MPAGGKVGNIGGGRKGHGQEQKIILLKGILVDAVIKDCEENPNKQLYWAEKFKDRLIPQEVRGGGEGGEFILKIVSADKYKLS